MADFIVLSFLILIFIGGFLVFPVLTIRKYLSETDHDWRSSAVAKVEILISFLLITTAVCFGSSLVLRLLN